MNAKILIVDDDQDITTMLEDRLQASDYGTLVASDGVQALEKVEQEAPHLMLLDLTGPLVAGRSIELTLQFANAGRVHATVFVLDARASGPSPSHGAH